VSWDLAFGELVQGQNEGGKEGQVLLVCMHANIFSPGFNTHLLSFALVSSEPERSKQNLSAKAPYHMHKVYSQLTLDLLKRYKDLLTILCRIGSL